MCLDHCARRHILDKQERDLYPRHRQHDLRKPQENTHSPSLSSSPLCQPTSWLWDWNSDFASAFLCACACA
ncbi:GL13318 [Drosophila persimilis]|uniref:GL13318 n=1 Tax=Drosophila persimilis TaxID=7234 RepID=B4H393_DROPE|nr:GL13318 [Drosophila persimilis]